MNRLLLLVALAGIAFAQDNSTVSSEEICLEYAECMEKAQAKSSECTASETVIEIHGKKANCEEARKVHNSLQKLYDERNNKMTTCVREKASDAEALTGKKADKCAAAFKKLSKRTSLEPSRREKRKEKRDKKEKSSRSCAKEARRLRSHCAKVAKCCSVAKECNGLNSTEEINNKKKELRDVVKQCREKETGGKKGKKHAKKDKKAESGEGPEPKKLKKEEKEKSKEKKEKSKEKSKEVTSKETEKKN